LRRLTPWTGWQRNKRHRRSSPQDNQWKICGAFYERLGSGDSFVWSAAQQAAFLLEGFGRYEETLKPFEVFCG
jgi:hypothetical protein